MSYRTDEAPVPGNGRTGADEMTASREEIPRTQRTDHRSGERTSAATTARRRSRSCAISRLDGPERGFGFICEEIEQLSVGLAIIATPRTVSRSMAPHRADMAMMPDPQPGDEVIVPAINSRAALGHRPGGQVVWCEVAHLPGRPEDVERA